MNRKRSAIPNIYGGKKKKTGNNAGQGEISTKEAIFYIRSLFPVEKFLHRLPPIIMKHQIYSLISNRTCVDKDLNDLCTTNEIRLFKFGAEEDEIAIILLDDYNKHVENSSHIKTVTDKFLKVVVSSSPDLSYDRVMLQTKYNFSESDISELINIGVLTLRDVGNFWLSIPRAGEFVKTFRKGRQALISVLKRTKYKELLQSELETRKLPKSALLTMKYHIHDIIGADLVTKLDTSSGYILRLKESEY